MLDLVRSKLEPAVDDVAPLVGRNQQRVSLMASLIRAHRSITTRCGRILSPCPPRCSVFGRGTSIKLCGLLRKTCAKIPAGPFRYSDARQ